MREAYLFCCAAPKRACARHRIFFQFLSIALHRLANSNERCDVAPCLRYIARRAYMKDSCGLSNYRLTDIGPMPGKAQIKIERVHESIR
ncbi:hypothetical protein LMG27174_05322 [Paraburkholderia rhynchosiae]|uniref:Uncharacterized protein n=1 Tax=Paraburkholderia rhynchosiae TaxID=487049 RepID=A0A6J5C3A0_9BURK|nr:hypothetical protein LMG27174_05322 [Paraburkholderia rhynchosiae]